ncbi:methionyl-tRNA formyltransferase, mitochondrial isoform X1 [Colletes gigas]|uniref:methionyl-tRNA formyltransferase, mitochondrial isoform X1 n=2 Tax=Colletes gigas TaxID=935657 RepID=UPI001C9A4894|nr:methionyl-tRNA formyltransferase, mitochondrial isoform X1 [Colletes gigas]XP_043251400.1 methionyl-tRNA formyltransferase, mitochondrial isoform X1 [Colletes gigas]
MVFFNLPISGTKQFLYTSRKLKKTLLSIVKTTAHCYVYNRESHAISQNAPWNVLFFGTDEFSVESLKILHDKRKSKVLQRLEVVTVNKGKENAIIKYAKENGIIIHEWPIEINVPKKFHIGIVVSFGHLIPSNIIDSFPLGMLNVHASLLPRWRGAAPIIYSLMNGEQETGVTIMKILPKKFDIGEIVLQKQIDIGEHETLPELYAKLAKFGGNLLGDIFDNLPQLMKSAVPQNEMNVTYAPKITSKIASIKWNEMSASNVYNLYRALLGLYPLVTTFQNTTIKLHDIKKIEKPVPTELIEEMPGVVIYDKINSVLIIKCKEDCVSVKKVVVRGKPAMSARDFNNGYIYGKNKTKEFFS